MTGRINSGSRRCAIYTRKSTEEGLEQAFNSLDAQREACAAYILSQRHEGWTLVPDLYDDGGFSGGNMDRPGLRNLLDDVQAGRVDIIVVYKVDRLTRSLADFAKIVEVLDARGASFVSITQAFNTTSSMGRLTLNVLLSFAQFEREVTSERIRDKIAASKARGMWMGGVPPLGYAVDNRKLVIVPEDAATVTMIFRQYLALGSVAALKDKLSADGLRSRTRVSQSGRVYGGATFSRGTLYLMLQNRAYLGEVTHKGKNYPGEHDAIIEPGLFGQVGAMLAQNLNHHNVGKAFDQPSLLVGRIWDGEGRKMKPDHATKRGKRYRYYATHPDTVSRKHPAWRVPAGDLESIVLAQLRGIFDEEHEETTLLTADLQTIDGDQQREIIARYIDRVTIHTDHVEIMMSAAGSAEEEKIMVPATLGRRGRETRLALPPTEEGSPVLRDPALIKLVVKAHQAREMLEGSGGETIAELAHEHGYSRDYFGVLLRIAYLAPDILAAILEGRQPIALTRQRLARTTNLPIAWQEQREMLGFAQAR